MANPPFNVSGVDKDRLKDDKRFPFGLPTTDNANYLWIQEFYSALNDKGRGGFVMANSAGDARGAELEVRKKLIETGAVDVIVAVGPNFFYTVTLPCTLWFFDRAKTRGKRKDEVLFIDARYIYRQVTKALRDFRPEQIEFLANIVRLHCGEKVETESGSKKLLAEHFPSGRFRDVPGLCKVAKRTDIEAQGWSLNPGRYVGLKPGEIVSDEDFKAQVETLNEELEALNLQARELEQTIADNVAEILEA